MSFLEQLEEKIKSKNPNWYEWKCEKCGEKIIFRNKYYIPCSSFDYRMLCYSCYAIDYNTNYK